MYEYRIRRRIHQIKKRLNGKYQLAPVDLFVLTIFAFLVAPITAHPRTESMNKIEVQTLDGCRHRISELHSNIFPRFEWYGVCHNGYSLGPGLLVRRDISSGKNIIAEVRRVWSLNGRIEGESVEQNGVSISVDQLQAFEWNNVRYELENIPYQGDPEDLTTRPSLRLRSSKTYEGYYISDFCTRVNSNYCIRETLRDISGTKENLLPCKSDCVKEWNKIADPFFIKYRSYIANHSPEIENEKQAIRPILAPLLQAKVSQLEKFENELFRELEERAFILAAKTKESQARHKQLFKEKASEEDAEKAIERREFWSKALNGLLVVGQIVAEQKQAKIASSPNNNTPSPRHNNSDAITSQDELIKSLKAHAIPECVNYEKNRFYNVCNFDIEILFCIHNPVPFDKAPLTDAGAAYDCAKNQGGLWTIEAGSAMAGTFSGERATYSACKRPYSPVKLRGLVGAPDYYACK